jgi:carbonic anhydrase
VLKTPTQISAEEVAAFAKLYPHNARPTQPLNGREVLESE